VRVKVWEKRKKVRFLTNRKIGKKVDMDSAHFSKKTSSARGMPLAGVRGRSIAGGASRRES
jgi:hypothetical protein